MSYYAVCIGRRPGIYQKWDGEQGACVQISGYSGALHRCFSTLEEAQKFMLDNGITDPLIVGKLKPTIKIRVKVPLLPSVISEQITFYHSLSPNNDILYVYTDGSTLANGTSLARGGYGVFFSTILPPISQRLIGGKITNGVAELTAMVEALKALQPYVDKIIEIHYDSTYAASVVTGRYNAWTNLELVTEAKSLLKTFANLSFHHVHAHTGASDLHSVGNHIADLLAGANG